MPVTLYQQPASPFDQTYGANPVTLTGAQIIAGKKISMKTLKSS